jgi:hypothetical protein
VKILGKEPDRQDKGTLSRMQERGVAKTIEVRWYQYGRVSFAVDDQDTCVGVQVGTDIVTVPLGQLSKEDQAYVKTASESVGVGKRSLKTWQRILLEDKVFTPEQLDGMHGDALILDEVNKMRGQAQLGEDLIGLYLHPEPKQPISIDLVRKLYGTPDLGASVPKDGTQDGFRYGPINLLTKKGDKGIIGLAAPGTFFLDGLKKAAQTRSKE